MDKSTESRRIFLAPPPLPRTFYTHISPTFSLVTRTYLKRELVSSPEGFSLSITFAIPASSHRLPLTRPHFVLSCVDNLVCWPALGLSSVTSTPPLRPSSPLPGALPRLGVLFDRFQFFHVATAFFTRQEVCNLKVTLPAHSGIKSCNIFPWSEIFNEKRWFYQPPMKLMQVGSRACYFPYHASAWLGAERCASPLLRSEEHGVQLAGSGFLVSVFLYPLSCYPTDQTETSLVPADLLPMVARMGGVLVVNTGVVKSKPAGGPGRARASQSVAGVHWGPRAGDVGH